MSMSLRLSEEAVRGSAYQMSDEARESLQRGDVGALIASHRDRFGDWSMELADEGEDEDEDDDSEDGDDDDEDDDDSDDDADEDGPEGKKSKKAAKDAEDAKKDPQKKIAALEDEKNRLYRGRQRARKERDELLKKVEQLEKDAPGDDDLKNEVKTQAKTIMSLQSQLTESQLANAFLADNTYEWVNPSQALKLAELSDIEIDDDGKVHGLTAALEALATGSPHLLKQKAKPKPTPRTSTGTPPVKKSVAKEKAARDAVRKKYRIGG